MPVKPLGGGGQLNFIHQDEEQENAFDPGLVACRRLSEQREGSGGDAVRCHAQGEITLPVLLEKWLRWE